VTPRATLGALTPIAAMPPVIGNDPWTGEQVMIDPATKKIVSPADFPLANFKIDGYQPVTVN
jgi:hypothetical protein